jgi:hypothetical protein
MSRHGKKIKGIYDRVARKSPEIAEMMALPILVHGDKLSNELHGPTERIINVRMKRI